MCPISGQRFSGRCSFSRNFIFDPPALGKVEGNATLGGQLDNAQSRIQVVGLIVTSGRSRA